MPQPENARPVRRSNVYLLICLLVCVALVFALANWGWVSADVTCEVATRAAWISVDWVAQPVDAQATAALAESAQTNQMQHLSVYTTYLNANGKFNATFEHASAFVQTFRHTNQQTRLLAWVGLPLKNTRTLGIQGWVDLADAATRADIVQFIASLVNDAGFEGVHLNAETVHNMNLDYLLLLEELRLALGTHKTISIAGSHWVPDWANQLPVIRNLRWTGAYYQLVAQRVDQIAVMSYDSHLPTPALYRLWVREQVRGIQNSLRQMDAALLFGFSASKESTAAHHPQAESFSNAAAGLCAATTASQPVPGAAIYAFWDFTAADWR